MKPEENAEGDDIQLIDAETARDLKKLHDFIKSDPSEEKEATQPDDGISALVEGWRKTALEGLFELELEVEQERRAPSYTVHRVERSSGERTYRANTHIDEAFGSLTNRVLSTTELMLERVVEGRTRCFVRTARQHGLSWRRKPGLPFPHPLPYLSPPPSEADDIYAEEASVIAAALHFPLTKEAPGVALYIDEFSRGPSGSSWVLGKATVNLYDSKRYLRIYLNSQAYSESGFEDDVWAGTIVHEILHNLGWGHPDGGYTRDKAIVNFDRCVRGDRDKALDEKSMIR